ncbi:hypothetical protein ACSVDA_20845 [Cytobacillus sp. Hm23]
MKEKDCKCRVVPPPPQGPQGPRGKPGPQGPPGPIGPPGTPKIVSFRAEKNSQQEIDGGPFVIIFQNVIYDCVPPPGNYIPDSSTFIAPCDGIYHFTSSAVVQGDQGTNIRISITLGGDLIRIACDSLTFFTDEEVGCVNVGTSIDLLTGDRVMVVIETTGNVVIIQNDASTGNRQTCFTGEIVNDMCP